MAEDAEKDQAVEEGAADPAASGKSRLLLIVMAAVVLLGGGAAVFFLMGSDEEVAEPEVVEQIPLKMEYLELDPPFIVNVPDRGRQRFLQVTATVMTGEEGTLFHISNNMPIVRHHLSNLLSAQTLDDIQSPGGIERLRLLASQELNGVMTAELADQTSYEVLFTSFVMQ